MSIAHFAPTAPGLTGPSAPNRPGLQPDSVAARGPRFPTFSQDIARSLAAPKAPGLRSRPSLRPGAFGVYPAVSATTPAQSSPRQLRQRAAAFSRTPAARATGLWVEPGSDFRHAEDPRPSSHRALGIPDRRLVRTCCRLVHPPRPRLFRARKSLGLSCCLPRPGSEGRASEAVTPVADPRPPPCWAPERSLRAERTVVASRLAVRAPGPERACARLGRSRLRRPCLGRAQRRDASLNGRRRSASAERAGLLSPNVFFALQFDLNSPLKRPPSQGLGTGPQPTFNPL